VLSQTIQIFITCLLPLLPDKRMLLSYFLCHWHWHSS
jgi:hypothetical protein